MKREFHLDDAQYGRLETGFSWAFALGASFFGFLADRVSVRWLYPFVLIAWSTAGLATAYAAQIGGLLTGRLGWTAPVAENPANHEIYAGLLVCRTLLGFFESGQWPCALITTQRILSNEDRSFGNSILQSGASIAKQDVLALRSVAAVEHGSNTSTHDKQKTRSSNHGGKQERQYNWRALHHYMRAALEK